MVMKKVLIMLILGLLVAGAICIDARAAKKTSKVKGLPQDTIQQMSDEIDRITKKIYGHALLSPEDNQSLIEVKIKLDNQIIANPEDLTLAPLYYKAGVIYKLRDMKEEAIECFQTVLENYGDTALAPKSRASLRALGVEVKEPEKILGSEEEEE